MYWLIHLFSNGDLGSEHFVIGILLIVGWIVLLMATQRSLGTVVLVLVFVLFAGLVWLLTDVGIQ